MAFAQRWASTAVCSWTQNAQPGKIYGGSDDRITIAVIFGAACHNRKMFGQNETPKKRTIQPRHSWRCAASTGENCKRRATPASHMVSTWRHTNYYTMKTGTTVRTFLMVKKSFNISWTSMMSGLPEKSSTSRLMRTSISNGRRSTSQCC